MKKVFKSMMVLSLGLALVMTGCDKDEKNDNNQTPINRDGIVGEYTTSVYLDLLGFELPAEVVASIEGTNELKIKSTVTVPNVPEVGTIDISLILNSLKEFSITDEEEGITTTGFLYKIASQKITVGIKEYDFVGVADSDYNFEGVAYHGFIGTTTKGSITNKVVGFAIKGDVDVLGILSTLTIYVESSSSDSDDDDTTTPTVEDYIGTWNVDESSAVELVYEFNQESPLFGLLSILGGITPAALDDSINKNIRPFFADIIGTVPLEIKVDGSFSSGEGAEDDGRGIYTAEDGKLILLAEGEDENGITHFPAGSFVATGNNSAVYIPTPDIAMNMLSGRIINIFAAIIPPDTPEDMIVEMAQSLFTSIELKIPYSK